MEFQEIVKLVFDNGTTICILAYFIYKDYKTTSLIQESLTKLNETTTLIKDLIINNKE